jgi:membrane-associated HD superfamily phosphohydrolase
MAPERWTVVRTEAGRVLDTILRTELKETQVPVVAGGLAGRMSTDLTVDERRLAASIIGDLVVASSSFDAQLTETRRGQAAAAVEPVLRAWELNEIVVRAGDRVGARPPGDRLLRARHRRLDVARLAGFVVLSVLLVSMLLIWTWRFRRELWHRNNVLLLRPCCCWSPCSHSSSRPAAPGCRTLPLAAIGMLVTVLLDAGVAMVMMALIAILAAAVNGARLELAAYVLLGGMAGIMTVRRGGRLACSSRPAWPCSS